MTDMTVNDLYEAQKALEASVEKFARGEMPSDRMLTDFCRAFIALQSPKLIALGKAKGLPQPGAADLDLLIEEGTRSLKESIRAGRVIVEISDDGNALRIVAAARH
jgi:hypothetical protein